MTDMVKMGQKERMRRLLRGAFGEARGSELARQYAGNAHDTAHMSRALHGSRGAGVRHRSLPPSRRGRCRIVLRRPSLPPSQPRDARHHRLDTASLQETKIST